MRFFFVVFSLLLLVIAPVSDCFSATLNSLYVTRVVDQTDPGGKYFFAEKADRSWAVKVILINGPLPSNGSTVNITGDLDVSGSLRRVTSAIYTITAAIGPLKSLAMSNKSLQLGLRGKSVPTHALLVTVWGKVCSVVEWDPVNQSYYFCIDDGIGRYGPDFTQSLKVFCDSYNSAYEGQYISIEGVVDTDANFVANYPVIWPTKPIQIHQ